MNATAESSAIASAKKSHAPTEFRPDAPRFIHAGGIQSRASESTVTANRAQASSDIASFGFNEIDVRKIGIAAKIV